eukprot:6143997-Amphidinium_carterae.1
MENPVEAVVLDSCESGEALLASLNSKLESLKQCLPAPPAAPAKKDKQPAPAEVADGNTPAPAAEVADAKPPAPAAEVADAKPPAPADLPTDPAALPSDATVPQANRAADSGDEEDVLSLEEKQELERCKEEEERAGLLQAAEQAEA